MSKKGILNPQDFYRGLNRKEKGKFLLYLSQRFSYPSSTISAKLRESPISELRKDEYENIMTTIESGIWKG